jgi:hypothetical protein
MMKDNDVKPVESGALAGVLFMMILMVFGCILCSLVAVLIVLVGRI